MNTQAPRAALHARWLLLLICASLAWSAPAARSQLLRVNCGDLNGFDASEPGWELMDETGLLPDMSLVPPPLDTVHVGWEFDWPPFDGVFAPPDLLTTDADQLQETHRNTSLVLAQGTRLRISGLVPNSLYRVRLETGALFPWIEPDASGFDFASFGSVVRRMKVEVALPSGGQGVTWRTAASELRGLTAESGATWDSIAASIIPVWVLGQTDDVGTLKLRFTTESGDPPLLTAFEVHLHEPLPIVYRRTAAGPLQAFDPAVQPFVDAFNAGDYAVAEARAGALTDPFLRGVALTHLAGWLDGSRDELFHLAGEAHAALELAVGHPAAAWLLDELGSFERALDHLAAIGHGHARLCPPEGPGYLNEDCTGQSTLADPESDVTGNVQIAVRNLAGLIAPVEGDTVLEDLVDWNSGTLGADVWEPSPLVFAAAKLTATSLVNVNPVLSLAGGSPGAFEMRQQIRDILDGFIDLGFAANDFPNDMELHLFREYVASGKHPFQWDDEELEALFTPQQLATAWWGDEVAPPPADPGAPLWANLQREQWRVNRSIVEYWVEERVSNHELGGGWGDDIELLGQLYKPYAALYDQTDRFVLDAIDELVRYGIGEQGDVTDGYYSADLTDVEHTAEYTTFTGAAHRGVYGHGAQVSEIALGVVEHLRGGDGVLAFAGTTSVGRLHFKSFKFTTDVVSTAPQDQVDILGNGRALAPGVSEALVAPLAETHPLLSDLTLWASAWAGDALTAASGKPLGWVGPVRWPSNEYGTNGLWYSTSGSSNDTKELTAGQITYALDAMRMVYRTSSDPNRWIYLVPIARVLRSVVDWEGGAGSPPTGTAEWAASLFKSSSRFGNFVITVLGDLRDEGRLWLETDPDTGEPYVDQELVDRMRTWVEVEFNGQNNALRYAVGEIGECGQGIKATNPLWNPYWTALDYYRPIYPLLTKHALRTDRVFLNRKGGGPTTLNAAANGAVPVEGMAFRPLVRWASRLDDGLDLAIQCNLAAYDGRRYSAFVYNFEPHAVELSMLLEEGLVPGRYRVEWGEATESCDMLPAGGLVGSQIVQKRGSGAPVTVMVRPGLNLVTADRLGPASSPAAGYDLSADTPMVRMLPSGDALAIEGRIVNFGRQASPTASATLSVALLDTDGRVVTLPGQLPEMELATFVVPPLAATPGWDLSQTSVGVTLPLGPPNGTGAPAAAGGEGGPAGPAAPASGSGAPGPTGGSAGVGGPGASLQLDPLPIGDVLGAALDAGMALQVRLVVTADGLEGDLIDNDTTRAWRLRQILSAK